METHFHTHDQAILWKRENETLRVEPWGPDAVRVRAALHPGGGVREFARREHGPGQVVVRNLSGYPNDHSVVSAARGNDRMFDELCDGARRLHQDAKFSARRPFRWCGPPGTQPEIRRFLPVQPCKRRCT